MDSFYKIKGDTLLFSDVRMDEIRHRIYAVFKIVDPIQAIVEAPDENINNMIEFYRINHPEAYPNLVAHYSPENTLKNVEKFYQKLQDCRHKMEAVGYSLFLIKNEISNYEKASIEDIKKTPMISMCPKVEFKNDILIYETESFLFQVKSSLDVLIQALKYVYVCLEDTKKYYDDNEDFRVCNNGGSIIVKLNNGGHQELANYFEEEYASWIKDLVELRNIITHKSGLENFFCFMFFNETNSLEKPKMPSGEYTEEYCEKTYENLLNLYRKVFEDFLLVELKDKLN